MTRIIISNWWNATLLTKWGMGEYGQVVSINVSSSMSTRVALKPRIKTRTDWLSLSTYHINSRMINFQHRHQQHQPIVFIKGVSQKHKINLTSIICHLSLVIGWRGKVTMLLTDRLLQDKYVRVKNKWTPAQ